MDFFSASENVTMFSMDGYFDHFDHRQNNFYFTYSLCLFVCLFVVAIYKSVRFKMNEKTNIHSFIYHAKKQQHIGQ